jgi:NADPH:quinone reductase-like Zn-dependent oxidoreductase
LIRINYTTEDFAAEMKRITRGKGVQSVLECVGGEIFGRAVGRVVLVP